MGSGTRACGQRSQDGLEELGLELLVAADHRLPQLTTVRVPRRRTDEAAVPAPLLLDATGSRSAPGRVYWPGKIWRIGCMGHTARPRNVVTLLARARGGVGTVSAARAVRHARSSCSGRRVLLRTARPRTTSRPGTRCGPAAPTGCCRGSPARRARPSPSRTAPVSPHAVRHPRARAPSRHRLRVRDLRRRALRRRDHACRRSSAGPFQSAFVGYWIDEALAGRGLVPEAVVVRCASPSRPSPCTAWRSPSSRATGQPAGGREAGIRDEGIAVRYLEIDGVWEDHVRYAITVGGVGRPRAAACVASGWGLSS